MRRALAVISVLVCTQGQLAQASPRLRQDGTLAVCNYTQFAPISYGLGQGYEPDLLRAVAGRWGVKVRFIPVDQFDGIWHVHSRHGCDVAVGGITPTLERAGQGAVFTPVTASFAQSLLVRRADYDGGRVTGYRSFVGANMTIGVVPGTTGESFAWLRGADVGLPRQVFRQFAGENQLIAALKRGEIAAIARGEIGNLYQQARDPFLVTVDRRDFGEGFAMSVDPGNIGLQRQLAEALLLITKNGKIGFLQWINNPGIFSR